MPSFFYLCEIDNLNALFLSIFKSCQSTAFSVGFYISHKKVCVVYHPLISFCYGCLWVCFTIYWIPYLVSLILSTLWNFTLNRRYTFKSAANVPVAMAKVFLFYLVFIPVSTYLGDLAEAHGGNDFVILIITMVANLTLEFIYCKLFVYRGQENTLDTKKG